MCNGICSMCTQCTVVINNQQNEEVRNEVVQEEIKDVILKEPVPEFEVKKTFLGKYIGKQKDAKLKLVGIGN